MHTKSAVFTAWCLAGMCCGTVSAQVFKPELAMDLSNTPTATTSSFVAGAAGATVNGLVVFPARNAEMGAEVWVTDATTENTHLLRDIAVGSRSSDPAMFVTWNRAGGEQLVVFAATSTDRLRELWVSDGTRDGTRPLCPVNPWTHGALRSMPVTTPRGVFVLLTVRGGYELWFSDGSAEPAVLTASFSVNAQAPVLGLTAVGDRVFFKVVSSDPQQQGLWVSDGTVAGTRRISTMISAADVCRAGIVDMDGTAMILGSSCGAATELWRSDGSPENTVRVRQFSSSCTQSYLSEMTVWNGRLWFGVTTPTSPGLWSSDGTPDGTRLEIGNIRLIYNVQTLNEKLLFAGVPLPGTTRFVFLSDGTPGNTKALTDTSRAQFDRVFKTMELAGRDLFFTCSGACPELVSIWRTDGTAAGTTLASDTPVPYGVTATGIAVGPGSNAVVGQEPFITDGTAQGSGLLLDIASSPGESRGTIRGTLGTSALVWAFAPESPARLWGLDLRGGDPIPLAMADLETTMQGEAFDGRLWFPGRLAATGVEPWTTDLTPSGTWMFGDLCPGSGSSLATGSQSDSPFVVAGENMFFSWGCAAKLQVTRGVGSGTHVIDTGGATVASLHQGAALGDRAIFLAKTAATGTEPWVTDGTSAGTFMLADTTPGSRSALWWSDAMVAAGNAYLLLQSEKDAGVHLWVTDGTVQGTRDLSGLFGIGTPDDGKFLGALGDSVVVALKAKGGDGSVWLTNGQPQGTRRLMECNGNASDAMGVSLCDGVLMAISTPSTGRELWMTDGTAEGTVLVKDVLSGPGDGVVIDKAPYWTEEGASFVAVGRRAFFAADDGIHGVEMWSTDGTAAGTRMVDDLWPGAAGSWPQQLRQAGGVVVYGAYTPDHGREIWKVAACPADFDRSGFADGDDFDAFVSAFERGDASADLDGSGEVDTEDFDVFVREFEGGC